MRNILSTVIGAVGLAFLARIITQEDMGVLAVLSLLLAAIQIISGFGIPQALAKYVAELKGREEDFSAYFLSTLTFKISSALVICLIVYSISGSVSSIILKSMSFSDLVRLAVLDAFISAFIPVFNSLLLGAGLLRRMALCSIFSAIARWTGIVAFAYLGYGLYGAVLGWVVGDLFGAVIYAAASASLVRVDNDVFRKSVRLMRPLLGFSWPLFVASTIAFIYAWYDQALVIAFLPLGDVGVYNISRKAFGFISGIASALGQSLFPYYGMTYGRGKHEEIGNAIKKASRYTMLVMFPLSLGLASTAKPVITLFAGNQYEPGWSVLAIMSIFGLVYGIQPVLSGLLVIYGRTKTVMFINVMSVLFSLVLLPAVGILGLNGLALIKGISLLATLILNIIFVSKVVRVEVDREMLTKAAASASIMAVIVFFIQQVYYSKFLLPFYTLAGATAYFLGIRILKVMGDSDIQLLTKMIGERNALLIGRIMGYKSNNQNGKHDQN